MYLALFLTPWVLIYAVSTMAMNHREFFRDLYGGQPVQWEIESGQTYSGTIPEGAKPAEAALQILESLGMDGSHGARAAGGRIIINRMHPVNPRRITYNPANRSLLVEKQVFRAPVFLERMHRRRGFEQNYALDDTWGLSVDVFIVAMLFWVASGLWMWWEMKVTRLWGGVFGLAGLALFAYYLKTL